MNHPMSDALDGRSVVITRSASQNASLRMLLEARGADVIEVPLISIEPGQSDPSQSSKASQATTLAAKPPFMSQVPRP